MTEVRPSRSIRPQILAHQYRLNIKPQREVQRILDRTRPEEVPPEQEELVHKNKPQLKINTCIEEDFEREEDDFYFDLDSPAIEWNKVDPVVQTYEAACTKLNIVPSTSVKTNLVKKVFSQKYNQLQANDCKAICYALVDNMHVHQIEFEQNGLCDISINHLSQVITPSSFITHVTLTDNALKSQGAQLVCESVKKNNMIEYLDLSGNGFVESDGKIFRDMIENAHSLSELYLARNSLMDVGVKEIAIALESTMTLKVLDLQWNHIRLGGAVAIGEAIEENCSLQVLNLAWNGLYKEGAEAIGDALKVNETLKEIDLTCNRLSEECFAKILLGLDVNNTLEVLRLGQNHISCTGAEFILRKIFDNKTSGIKMLDFGNQEVKETFVQLYNDLRVQRGVHVIYGMVWDSRRKSLSTSGEDDDELALLSLNPLTVLMECMRLQNFRLIDLFKSLDTNKSNMVCINELCDGLLRVGVPVKRTMLLKLLSRLDKDNNKQLDFGEMVEAQNIHRQNLRRTLQAVGDGDFEQTAIGKVSLILRRIMAKNIIMKKQENDSRLKIDKQESRTPSPYNMDSVETRMGLETKNSKASVKPGNKTSLGSKSSSRASSASGKSK